MRVGAAKKKPAPAAAPDPDDLFGDLDLRKAQHQKERICPGCAVPVDPDETVCPACGVEIETGQLSERERLRRRRKGPPPEEFYGAAIADAWNFVRVNRGRAITTGLIWAVTVTMAICSAFILTWYIDTREAELRDSASGNIEVTDEYVLIDLREDPDNGEARYDGKRYTKSAVNEDFTLRLPGPRQGAMQSPPSIFWGTILLISVLAFGGRAWILAVAVVRSGLDRQKQLKRFQSDLFGSMAMGFRSIFWPLVLMWPFLWIPPLVQWASGSATAGAAAWGVLFLIPILFFLPPALVHLTQKYTYRAWLLNWMLLDWLKTAGAALYSSALLFGFVLFVPLACLIAVAVLYHDITRFYTQQVEVPILSSLTTYDPGNAATFGTFTFLRLPLVTGLSFVTASVVCGCLAFPALFVMRVFGVYAYYFRPDLSLINEQKEFSPAGFGPRFLAGLIDSLILSVLAGVAYFAATLVSGLFGGLWGFSSDLILMARFVLFGAATLILWALYFSTWESGQNRGTLGKAALGIIVVDNDNQPISARQALRRTVFCLISVLTLFIGFAMCAFQPDKRALHDLLSKTQVVWRGEVDE